jgi:hypothetical protein
MMLHMKYDVVIKRKVAKGLRKLPVWVQKKTAVLAEDLREKCTFPPLSDCRISCFTNSPLPKIHVLTMTT